MANAVGYNGGKIVKIKSGEDLDVGGGDLKVDQIAESTSNAGVTIDGVLIKDNDIVIPDGSTIGASSAATAITIAASGNVSLSNDLIVTGSLNVAGANNIISATTVQYEDTLLELGMEDDGSGGVQAPTTQTAKDIGLIFHVHDGSNADKDALFLDATNGQYYLKSGVSETNGVLSGGSAATLNATFVGNITGNVTGNASGTAGSLASAQNFSLTGDVTATAVSFNGTGAVALATTIAAGAVDFAMIADTVDEDNMASNSATKIPTQQSVKAYVDAEISSLSSSTSFAVGAVAAAGGVGQGKFLVVTGTAGKLAEASNNNADYIIGIAAANAAEDAAVSVFKEGIIMDTQSTFSGTSPAVGDALFLGANGQDITVDPPTSGQVIRVGTVVTTAGKMLLKIQHIMSN